jgi:hypothetical protein
VRHHIVVFQGGAGGIQDGAATARDKGFQRGREGRVSDGVGQIHHLAPEDRS